MRLVCRPSWTIAVVGVLVWLSVQASTREPGDNTMAQPRSHVADSSPRSQLPDRLAQACIAFIENRGQVADSVTFYARGLDSTTYVTEQGEILYDVPSDVDQRLVVKDVLLGHQAPSIAGRDRAPTQVSYFRGQEPERWRSALPTFERVTLGEVYPGIVLDLRARGGRVEKVFTVGPQANPGVIRLRLEGADEVLVNASGELQFKVGDRAGRFSAPVAYQLFGQQTHDVAVRYVVSEDTYGFEIGAYDPRVPLVIDPTLVSTYYGGLDDEWLSYPVFDGSGNIYVAGGTSSTDLPMPGSGYDSAKAAGQDGYIAKFNPSLTTLLAATFVGGSANDYITDLAFDADWNLYATASTYSTDFPTTAGAFDGTWNGGTNDAAVIKLDSALGHLLASTYLGGSQGTEWLYDVEVGHSGSVFVAGHTHSSNWPIIPGAFDSGRNPNGTHSAVISRLSPDLAMVEKSTFFDSGRWDVVYSMTLDGDDNVYVVGRTSGSGLPITIGPGHSGGGYPYYEGFIGKLNRDLTTRLAARYLGTAALDIVEDIALAGDGSVYVTGETGGSTFPVVGSVFDPTYAAPSCGSAGEGFVSHLDDDLMLLQSTFLGGSGCDSSLAVTVDTSGDVHVAGRTNSVDFQTTPDGLSPSYNGPAGAPVYGDGFYVRVSSDLAMVYHGTYLGGTDYDTVGLRGVRLNGSEVPYLAGTTWSSDFPTSTGAHDESFNGGADDGFVTGYGTTGNTPPEITVGTDPLVLEGSTCGGYDNSGDLTAAADVSTSDPDGDIVTLTNDAPALLPFGDTLVTWTAVDSGGSGEAVMATQTVRVVLGPSTFDALIAEIEAMGLHHGIENALRVKVEAAASYFAAGQFDDAADSLNALMHQINAQKGKKVTAADADALLSCTGEVLAAL